MFYCVTDDWLLMLLVVAGMCCVYILMGSLVFVVSML